MPIFLPQERSTRLLWTTRFGQVHSALVLPLCGESDHHDLILRGLLFEKESPKSYAKGLRGRFFCRFEVYRIAINSIITTSHHKKNKQYTLHSGK